VRNFHEPYARVIDRTSQILCPFGRNALHPLNIHLCDENAATLLHHVAIMLQRCAKNTADVLHLYGNQQRHRFPESLLDGHSRRKVKESGAMKASRPNTVFCISAVALPGSKSIVQGEQRRSTHFPEPLPDGPFSLKDTKNGKGQRIRGSGRKISGRLAARAFAPDAGRSKVKESGEKHIAGAASAGAQAERRTYSGSPFRTAHMYCAIQSRSIKKNSDSFLISV
jgi:hypothetical protein